MNESLKAQLDEQRAAERAAALAAAPFSLRAWQLACAAVSDETLRVLALDSRPSVAATASAALAGLIVLSSEDVARLAATR
jgi:hypothetical protein